MNSKVVFLCGWGPEEEGRLSSLFFMVETATVMNFSAAVFFFASAAVLAMKGAFEKVDPEIGRKFHQLTKSRKVEFYVCEAATRKRGIREETIEDGIKIMGYAAFLDIAASATTVITI